VTESSVNPPGGVPDGTSLTLLEKARSGSDPAAWERLVSLYEPLVNRWCRQAGLQWADVEDVRMEVFAAVSRSLGTFERTPEQGTFRGWLRRITQNKLRDHWQQEGKGMGAVGGSDALEQMRQLPSPEADPSGAGAAEETGILYRRALELISRDFEERTRKAFWRVVIDGQRPRDVARELNMTPGAVSSAKARVLARLRQEFGDLLSEGAAATSCLPSSETQPGAGDAS
jgi:RNA polymerase sigma-70 factor (ECF subfamily)